MLKKRIYQGMAFIPYEIVPEQVIAASVVNNSIVSSVGQEVGEEVTFTEESFANNNWESGE